MVRLALITLLLLIPAGNASAVFYNNTETIEIGDGALPPERSPDSTTDRGNSGGSGSGWTGGGQTSTGSGAGTTTASTTNSGSSGSGSDESDPAVTVISVLVQGGALSGKSLLNGVGGAGGGGEEGNISIRIIGSKVRQALSGNISLKDFLNYWRLGSGKAGEKELSLIAASTALRDANMQEISFTADAFEIVYRSRGYLLGFIPWSFPVTVKVIPEATVLEERIVIRLPWYRFFIRKFFTANGLRKDIDEVMAKAIKDNTNPDADENVLLFEAVSMYLRQKVGTVADSVLLGN